MPEATQGATVQITLTNPGAYTTGQAIGTTITLPNLGIGGGVLASMRLTDVGQSGAVDVVIYNAPPTVAGSDRTTYVGATDRGKVIAILSITATSYSALGSNAGQGYVSVGIPVQYSPTLDGNLYAQLVARGSITYASGDLYLRAGRSY